MIGSTTFLFTHIKASNRSLWRLKRSSKLLLLVTGFSYRTPSPPPYTPFQSNRECPNRHERYSMWVCTCTYLQSKDGAFIHGWEYMLRSNRGRKWRSVPRYLCSSRADVFQAWFVPIGSFSLYWCTAQTYLWRSQFHGTGFDTFMNGIEVRGSTNIIHRSPWLVSSTWTFISSVENLLICGKIHWWKSGEGGRKGRRRRRRLYAFTFLLISALSNVH